MAVCSFQKRATVLFNKTIFRVYFIYTTPQGWDRNSAVADNRARFAAGSGNLRLRSAGSEILRFDLRTATASGFDRMSLYLTIYRMAFLKRRVIVPVSFKIGAF